MNIEQRDMIIRDIEQMRLSGASESTILRLRFLLAGVENNAQWFALYDTLEQAYINWRIDHAEAIDGLRWLGIDARTDIDEKPFGILAETHRQQNAAKMKDRFNAVDWELGHLTRKLTLVSSRGIDE